MYVCFLDMVKPWSLDRCSRILYSMDRRHGTARSSSQTTARDGLQRSRLIERGIQAMFHGKRFLNTYAMYRVR